MANKDVYTRDDFVTFATSIFRNTPKCTCKVREMFEPAEPEIRGESLVKNKAQDMHEIYLHECLFDDFNYLLSIVAHESAHSAVHETLNTLCVAGVINDALFEMLSEKVASLCEEITYQILEKRELLEGLFNKIDENVEEEK